MIKPNSYEYLLPGAKLWGDQSLGNCGVMHVELRWSTSQIGSHVSLRPQQRVWQHVSTGNRIIFVTRVWGGVTSGTNVLASVTTGSWVFAGIIIIIIIVVIFTVITECCVGVKIGVAPGLQIVAGNTRCHLQVSTISTNKIHYFLHSPHFCNYTLLFPAWSEEAEFKKLDKSVETESSFMSVSIITKVVLIIIFCLTQQCWMILCVLWGFNTIIRTMFYNHFR